MRMMLVLAEDELERITENWDEARRRAVERGLHLTATVPFGYRRREDNGLEPDPVNGPIVTELFERRADGEGWADLGRWMESNGAKTQRGRDDVVAAGAAGHHPQRRLPRRRRARRVPARGRARAAHGRGDLAAGAAARQPDPLAGEGAGAARRAAALRRLSARDGGEDAEARGRAGCSTSSAAARPTAPASGACQAWAACPASRRSSSRSSCALSSSSGRSCGREAAEASAGRSPPRGAARARATLAEYAADHGLQERLGWEAYQAGLRARARRWRRPRRRRSASATRRRRRRRSPTRVPRRRGWAGCSVEERRAAAALRHRHRLRPPPVLPRRAARRPRPHPLARHAPGRPAREGTTRLLAPSLPLRRPDDVGTPAAQDREPGGGD